MTSIGVILSGCGVNDGSEIHEAVITMLCLDRVNAKVHFFAPDIDQAEVIDHSNGLSVKESRNIKAESARITRGNIDDIANADHKCLDAIILPGGSGAMKNLSRIGATPKTPLVNLHLKNLIKSMHSNKKPIGAICISPVLIASVLGNFSPSLTIGNDINAAALLESYGAKHENKSATEICFDEKNLILSTPAYMLAKGPNEVYEGISELVNKILYICNIKE